MSVRPLSRLGTPVYELLRGVFGLSSDEWPPLPPAGPPEEEGRGTGASNRFRTGSILEMELDLVAKADLGRRYRQSF